MTRKKRTESASARPTALYVYCIGDASGLEGAAGDLPEPIEPAEGFELVAADDLAALASRVPLADYGEGAFEARLSDPGWTAERAMKHEVVLERLASRAAIVPLRLGAIFLDRSRIEAMLRERYAEFREMVSRLGGRDEWSVAVYCDRNELAGRITGSSARLRELSAQAASASKGQAYLLTKKIEALRAEEARAWIRSAVSDVENRLRGVSEDLRPLGLASSGPDPDGAAAKLGCLVRREAFQAFRTAAEDLATHYRQMGLRLELVGPLPAYNFVEKADERP